jgi:hypothetical protein
MLKLENACNGSGIFLRLFFVAADKKGRRLAGRDRLKKYLLVLLMILAYHLHSSNHLIH